MSNSLQMRVAMSSAGERKPTPRDLLDLIRDKKLAQDNFLGVLHILIGRRISLVDGTEVSNGITWRELAALLKKVRWDKQAIHEVGVDPATLPPRDRQRYWYQTISQAGVDSEEALEAGDRLAEALQKEGYVVGPPPS